MHRGAAERIDADLHARGADGLHVDHIAEVLDIGRDEIVPVNVRRLAGAIERNPLDAAQHVLEQRVGVLLDHAGDVGVGRAAIGRVIFEAAIFRRIVRRRDHHAIGQAAVAAAIIGEDGVRDHRGRRKTVLRVDHHIDFIGGEHFQRAGQCRFGERMGVDTDEQRPGDAGLAAIVAYALRHRQDVGFIEGVVE